MARSGSLPRALAKVHPKYKTPVNGVKLQILLTFVVGLGLGWWIGPELEFEFMGTLLTFALILTFSAANLGVFPLLFQGAARRIQFRSPRDLSASGYGFSVFCGLQLAAAMARASCRLHSLHCWDLARPGSTGAANNETRAQRGMVDQSGGRYSRTRGERGRAEPTNNALVPSRHVRVPGGLRITMVWRSSKSILESLLNTQGHYTRIFNPLLPVEVRLPRQENLSNDLFLGFEFSGRPGGIA